MLNVLYVDDFNDVDDVEQVSNAELIIKEIAWLFFLKESEFVAR